MAGHWNTLSVDTNPPDDRYITCSRCVAVLLPSFAAPNDNLWNHYIELLPAVCRYTISGCVYTPMDVVVVSEEIRDYNSK